MIENSFRLALSELGKAPSRFKDDPIGWGKRMIGPEFELWSVQNKIALSVVENHNTAVAACHGSGKSFLAAFLTCWWVDTRHPDAFVATTAPSMRQVNAIVWGEIRRIKSAIKRRFEAGLVDHQLPGEISAVAEWKIDSGLIIGFGAKPPEKKEDDRFQGIHARYVLAIGDEAVGLNEDLIDSLQNITVNADSRVLLICNPTNANTFIGRVFRKKTAGWRLFNISAFDTPNFTGEKVPDSVKQKLIDREYVESKKRDYGESTPRYIARVLGQFSFDLSNSLITPEHTAKGFDTEIEGGDFVELGVDVARFGEDKSAVVSNRGGRIRVEGAWAKESVVESAKRVWHLAFETGAGVVRVDAVGVGGGLVDLLAEWLHGSRPPDLPPCSFELEALNSNAQAPDPLQWRNARAFWWDSFRKGLEDGLIDLDPEDESLADELCSTGWKSASGARSGAVQMESKEDMRKEGRKSPDLADAAVYAWAGRAQSMRDLETPGDPLDQELESLVERAVRMDGQELALSALDW